MTIEQAITKFCIAKGIDATAERISIQAGYLRKTEFGEVEIVKAIGAIFGKTPFFPDASLILKELKPDDKALDHQAQDVVDKIMDANSRFGSPLEAKKFLGDNAWNVVERFGGWSTITNLTYSDLGVARSQLRRIAESQSHKSSKQKQLDVNSNGLKRLDFAEYNK